MSRQARNIKLANVVAAIGTPELVIVGANDPDTMFCTPTSAANSALAFAADPSQQLARLSGEETKRLIDGATLFVHQRLRVGPVAVQDRLTDADVLAQVGPVGDHLGAKGVDLVSADGTNIHVDVVPERPPRSTGPGGRRLPGRFPDRAQRGARPETRRATGFAGGGAGAGDHRHPELDLEPDSQTWLAGDAYGDRPPGRSPPALSA